MEVGRLNKNFFAIVFRESITLFHFDRKIDVKYLLPETILSRTTDGLNFSDRSKIFNGLKWNKKVVLSVTSARKIFYTTRKSSFVYKFLKWQHKKLVARKQRVNFSVVLCIAINCWRVASTVEKSLLSDFCVLPSYCLVCNIPACLTKIFLCKLRLASTHL